jgi:hypothetical protein
MTFSIPCVHCSNEIPQPSERCPHCARPGIYWNVITANEDQERTELLNRYNSAKADALRRETNKALVDFEGNGSIARRNRAFRK